MTLKEAEKLLLSKGITDAKEEARIIFSKFGGEPMYKLLSPDYSSDSPEVERAIRERAERTPLAYIIGMTDFYRESYFVTPDCLIPRSDTEMLVDFAVKNIPDKENFVDLCTGSGCVAVSTLKNTRGTTAVAADISDGALNIARKNAKHNGVSDRIEFLCYDVQKEPVVARTFAVLSNPPYVSNECYKTLEAEIYKEPKIAFLGGDDGGDFYRRLTALYRDVISDGGFIAYEIGYDQGELLQAVARENLMSIEILPDLAGRDRVAVLRRIK